MSTQQERERGILEACLKLPPKDRAAYLDKVCGGDDQFRQQIVEQLFKAGEQTGAGRGEAGAAPPLGTVAIPLVPEPPGEKAGDRIGRYKLLERIGEGGMGSVWVAEQTEPVRREVALKVIKLGMDTKQVIARFEAERQALALMDHPCIAKVLDAGATETGRPYFVMERVKGVPITEYCDRNQVSTRHRLELFIQVCQAVQHAHTKGIIHRDIKPSNILVTVQDGPVPKVIDFGIAKATAGQRLTEKTLHTVMAEFIGTPAYMSPEQAEMTGVDIDTRSDIYSMGVLLYELLTGRPPFDAKRLVQAGLEGIRRIIREEEPPRPSTRLSTLDAQEQTTVARRRQSEPPKLLHEVRGDLDWIVMKALEKDRTRRYETASGLASEVQHFLRNEPVQARPPSATYRFHKFVHRNRLAFTAGAALALTLSAGIVLSTWQAVRATRAEREQTRLRQIAETKEKKSERTAEFLKDMLKGVGPSVALGRDTTMLREIMDKTVERLALDLRDQPEVEIDLRLTLASVYFDLVDFRKMEKTAREALRLARANFGEENLMVADALNAIGRALPATGSVDEAESVTRQSLAMQRKLRGADSLEEASALRHLSDILAAQFERHPQGRGKLEEAEKASRACLAIRTKRLGHDTDEVAWALSSLQWVQALMGKLAEAEEGMREVLAIRRKIHGEEHPYTAMGYDSLAGLLLQQNRLEEAATNYQMALDIYERTAGQQLRPAFEHEKLAVVLARQGKSDEAEMHQREALTHARKVTGGDHPYLCTIMDKLVQLLRRNGKLAEARTLSEEEVVLGRRYRDGADRWVEDRAFGTLSVVLTELGDTAALEKTTREWLALREQQNPNDWRTFNTRSMLGGILVGQQKYAEAEPLLLSGYDGMRQREGSIPADYKGSLQSALRRLAQLYENNGRSERAAEARAKVTQWYRKEAESLRKGAESGSAGALNSLAWLLATCDDAAIRDGPGAVGYAEKAVVATDRKDAGCLDTLAAACAEAGQFAKAVTIQKEAMALLRDEERRKDYASRLKLYESSKPYRVSE